MCSKSSFLGSVIFLSIIIFIFIHSNSNRLFQVQCSLEQIGQNTTKTTKKANLEQMALRFAHKMAAPYGLGDFQMALTLTSQQTSEHTDYHFKPFLQVKLAIKQYFSLNNILFILFAK